MRRRRACGERGGVGERRNVGRPRESERGDDAEDRLQVGRPGGGARHGDDSEHAIAVANEVSLCVVGREGELSRGPARERDALGRRPAAGGVRETEDDAGLRELDGRQPLRVRLDDDLDLVVREPDVADLLVECRNVRERLEMRQRRPGRVPTGAAHLPPRRREIERIAEQLRDIQALWRRRRGRGAPRRRARARRRRCDRRRWRRESDGRRRAGHDDRDDDHARQDDEGGDDEAARHAV